MYDDQILNIYLRILFVPLELIQNAVHILT